MDQNTLLKREYFELCRRLNTSNLHKNQKTEVSFFIEQEKNRLVLFATTNKTYKIQLIFKYNKGTWSPSSYSGLVTLEYELAKAFVLHNMENLNSYELTKAIKSFIFQHLDEN